MSARSFVFTVDTDGSLETLWTDDLPLAEMGTLEISRASNVEFNQATQQWQVWFEDDFSPVFSHPSRAVCLAWEHEEFNARLLKGTR